MLKGIIDRLKSLADGKREQVTALQDFFARLPDTAERGLRLSINDDERNVVGQIGDMDGNVIASIVTTIGPIGGGPDAINGVQITRATDAKVQNYGLHEKGAVLDFLAGGDGKSINHYDPSGLPRGMRGSTR